MRYFSMFSGIGGFEKGIEQADVDNVCVGYSEIDKYAIKVYERHFGNDSNNEYAHIGEKSESEERSQGRKRSTDKHGIQLLSRSKPAALRYRNGGHTNYGDATTIDAKELPDFDLLVGGFPCQAFSVAGKRGGFNDTRGTLFFDIARILKEKRPRHLLLENVKGLLSHDKGKTFSTIIGVLSDLGYRVEWQVLNSKDFGVPQNRERVFIIGHSRNECRRQVFPIGASSQNDIDQLNQPTHSNDRVYGTEGLSPTLNTAQGGRRQPKIAPTVRANHHNTADIHFIPKDAKIRRLTPLECERLQGFPDDWTALGIGDEEISDTQRYKMCGNAVTVNVIEAIVTNFKCLEPA